MANRYITEDQTKWFGPTHIGPGKGDNSAKRISKFIFAGEPGSPVAKLGAAHKAATEATTSLRQQLTTVEATGKYLPLGIRETLAKHASEDNIPAVRRAKATVEKRKAEVADRYSKLTLAKRTDEERRDDEEIRTAMRGLSAEAHEKFMKQNRNNPAVAVVIAHARIPALVGLDEMVHLNIIAEQKEREHGETMAELRDLEEVIGVTERVVDLAREELREIIGVDRPTFEQIAAVGERNGGRLPFKVETEVQNGQVVEIAQVLDVNTKTWRRATSEEIMATRSDSAAA